MPQNLTKLTLPVLMPNIDRFRRGINFHAQIGLVDGIIKKKKKLGMVYEKGVWMRNYN